MPVADAPLTPRTTTSLDGWILHTFATVPSTNPLAGALPAWHAVRADTQTGGRGRTGRVWVSDAGGLWLSAVLPAPGPRKKWSIAPLGAGWAVIEALHEIGLNDLRLRWPNDILVGPRKLAGLLVEQYQPETIVIGVGINLDNRPATLDADLAGRTTNVNELAPQPVSLDALTRLTLHALRRLQSLIQQDRFPEIVTDINARWGDPRRVHLTLNTKAEPLQGYFSGVDPEGRLSFTDDHGTAYLLDATQVAHLREE